MNRYSPERKAAVLKKLLPPLSLSVAELARQEGISDVTLYTWRKQAKTRGEVVSRSGKVPEDWPAEAKLAAVIETATLSEVALSQYCREKGLYPEQVKAWRQACITGQQSAKVPLIYRAPNSNRRNVNKPGPTRSVSASWSVSSGARTGPWRKQPRCWCCEKN